MHICRQRAKGKEKFCLFYRFIQKVYAQAIAFVYLDPLKSMQALSLPTQGQKRSPSL
ncbi:MAG: hypothetical protein RM338_29450 [Nostoc sp. DedQUE12a]|nr:hypothetical protein [Nostoc sp. DedQUE12a]